MVVEGKCCCEWHTIKTCGGGRTAPLYQQTAWICRCAGLLDMYQQLRYDITLGMHCTLLLPLLHIGLRCWVCGVCAGIPEDVCGLCCARGFIPSNTMSAECGCQGLQVPGACVDCQPAWASA